MKIAEPPAGRLEVGFQEEGGIAKPLPPLGGVLHDFLHGSSGLTGPGLGHSIEDFGGQVSIAGDQPGREKRRGRRQIPLGQHHRFLGSPHTVTEPQASVPERVPEVRGEALHLDLRAMEQKDVDIALRA